MKRFDGFVPAKRLFNIVLVPARPPRLAETSLSAGGPEAKDAPEAYPLGYVEDDLQPPLL